MDARTETVEADGGRRVYASSALLRALLHLAEAAEPAPITVQLATTAAAEFDGLTAGDRPVFSHFYFPDAAPSNSAVFGMDLSVPLGRTHGLFVSHPIGNRSLSERDDLHERVFVAVPPWDLDAVSVFDRGGRRHRLQLVDATLPTEGLP